jgi:hypothetical protein
MIQTFADGRQGYASLAAHAFDTYLQAEHKAQG